MFINNDIYTFSFIKTDNETTSTEICVKRRNQFFSRFTNNDTYDPYIDIVNYFYSFGGFSIILENFSKVASNPFSLEVFYNDILAIRRVNKNNNIYIIINFYYLID